MPPPFSRIRRRTVQGSFCSEDILGAGWSLRGSSPVEFLAPAHCGMLPVLHLYSIRRPPGAIGRSPRLLTSPSSPKLHAARKEPRADLALFERPDNYEFHVQHLLLFCLYGCESDHSSSVIA